MNQEVLEKMGLNKNEAKVYLALLETGPGFAGVIAREAGINRRSVYDAAKQLIERGLVSYVLIKGKRQFQPSNPQRLLGMLQERESEVRDVLPDLLSTFSKTREKIEVEVFAGKEGIKYILDDVLVSEQKVMLDITSGMTTVLLPHYIPQWHRKRVKAGITLKALMNDTELGRKRGSELSKMGKTVVRFLPKGLASPVHVYVYGNKAAIAIWDIEHPLGILIENREIQVRFREFFEWFWRMSKP